MNTQTHIPPEAAARENFGASSPARLATGTLWLGIVLSSRDIGFAVTDGVHLLNYGLVNLRKLHSQEAKEARFRHRFTALLAAYPTAHLLVIPPYDEVADHPVQRAYALWLTDQARERGLRHSEARRSEVRATLAAATRSPETRRGIAEYLIFRFPEIRDLFIGRCYSDDREIPIATLFPKRPYLTSRERYWFPMLLALSGALVALGPSAMASGSADLQPHTL